MTDGKCAAEPCTFWCHWYWDSHSLNLEPSFAFREPEDLFPCPHFRWSLVGVFSLGACFALLNSVRLVLAFSRQWAIEKKKARSSLKLSFLGLLAASSISYTFNWIFLALACAGLAISLGSGQLIVAVVESVFGQVALLAAYLNLVLMWRELVAEGMLKLQVNVSHSCPCLFGASILYFVLVLASQLCYSFGTTSGIDALRRAGRISFLVVVSCGLIGLVAFAKLYGSRLATKLMMLERADEEAYVQGKGARKVRRMVGLLISCCIALLVSILLVEAAGPFSDWLLLGASVLFVCTYNCILLTSSTIFARTRKLQDKQAMARSRSSPGAASQARPSVLHTPRSSHDSRASKGTPRGSVSVRLESQDHANAPGLREDADSSLLLRQDSSMSLLGTSPSDSLYGLALDDSNAN